MPRTARWFIIIAWLVTPAFLSAEPLPIVSDVEGQPLAQNAERLGKALDFLGFPLSGDVAKELAAAIDQKDVKKIQRRLESDEKKILKDVKKTQKKKK